MKSIVEGKVFYCDDYVNTDVMAPGRFDPIYEDEKLAKIALIDYQGREPFVDQSLGRSKFSIIIAGEDFGCGSSRETAPLALAAAGARVVIAKSFARIFFRNCINLGAIYPLAIEHFFEASIHGKMGLVDFMNKKLIIDKHEMKFDGLGELDNFYQAGGLSGYIKKHKGFTCL